MQVFNVKGSVSVIVKGRDSDGGPRKIRRLNVEQKIVAKDKASAAESLAEFLGVKPNDVQGLFR